MGSITELGAAQQAVDLAALVRAFLLMPPLMDDGALDSIVEAARSAGPQLAAARELTCALPHLAEYFMADGADRLNALGAEDRERVRGEVRHYLENHPELAAPVTAG